VHFNGALANTAANLLSVGSAGLSGGAGTTVTRVSAGHANQNEIQTITVFATGGTFTLTEGAQTTSAIAFNASAATLKTRIEADLSATITTTTTSGAGTVASPYSVTVTAPANTNIAELTANAASLTGGGGTIAELTAGSAGASEVQLVTLEAGVSGGTFALSFNGSAECTPIAWNAAAATVQTDLRALPTVNTVSVSGSAGGPWTVTWSGAQANALQPLLIGDGANLTGTFGTQAVTVSTTTFSAGPNHYDTAANWSRGRVPDTGDSLYCEDGDSGCLYGIAQLCTITANAGTDVITFGKASGDTGGSFVNDQIVQFSNAGGGLPAGISAATNYYLINVDRNAATCQISASSGGSPIDITTAGTGTHTMGVRLDYAEMNSRFTGDVGLPRQNPGGYHEYRPRFLRIGLRAAGTQQIQIGTGDGTGSGKIQFDTGPDQVAGRLVDTGSGSESGIPAVVWKGSHASNVWEIINGNFGCALWAGEVANLGGAKPLILRQGQAELGTGTTVTGPIDQTGGKLISDGATINGQVVLR
jgi:hypothetical protein